MPNVSSGSVVIGSAREHDLPRLGEIERAAATLLAGHGPAALLLETSPLPDLERARQQGRLWVAYGDGLPIGFAYVKLLEPHVAHLEEIDVHPAHARRGVGTGLLRTVCDWSRRQNYRAVTLTTFRDVPWNMPFYARRGFKVVGSDQLSPALREILHAEAERGFDASRRVAMHCELPLGA